MDRSVRRLNLLFSFLALDGQQQLGLITNGTDEEDGEGGELRF